MSVKGFELGEKHCYYRCYYATVDYNSARRNNEGVSTSNEFIAVYLCMNMHYDTTAASDTLLPKKKPPAAQCHLADMEEYCV